MDTVIARLLY